MGLTKNQQYAVDHRGSSLLVSAGAGSGKTSTLSKRIISRISDPDDSCEITDFLIVTFTNASAQDLSEKIEGAVSECVAKDLSNKKAFRQLSKMKYANISTISSFCLNVVKSHFNLLALPAKIRVCDEAEAQILKKRTITQVLNEKYSTCPAGSVFYDLVEMFSGSKSDEGLENLIDRLHRKLIIFPEPREWADRVLENYGQVVACKSSDYLGTHFGSAGLYYTKRAASNMISELSDACDMLKDIPEMERYLNAMQNDIESANAILELSEKDDYESARLVIMSLSKTKFLPVKYDQDFKDSVKDIRDSAFKRFDAMRNNFFAPDFEKIRLAALDSNRILAALFDIVFEVDEKFSHQKASFGVVDFSDAERMTYRLFVENYDAKNDIVYPSDIAKKYRDSFAEIYIDEYQDVNPVQDMIFRSITRYSKDGYELNRFMVGDIKQSIYRFRGARPNLFSGYLDSFRYSDDDTLWAKKEFLSDNFRCSESVINFTNLVFSRIMQKTYSEKDALKFSRTENSPVKYPCEICVYEDTDSDDYYDAEIKHTAQKILEIVNSDKELSSEGKRFGFGDIAVLLPSPKKVAEKYTRYFEAHGIPTYSEITENFFENAEIILMLCLLNTIDNSMRDIYVAGAMRSEIFGFTDDELLEIRRFHTDTTSRDVSLWENVSKLSVSENVDSGLMSKCAYFVDVIDSLRKYSVGISSDKLILRIYSMLHISNIVSEKSFNRYTDAPSIRRENLSILYNLARGFEKNGYRGLSAFLEFLNIRAEKPDGVRSATSSDANNAVHIMSIHHSKGLEYPVCIICGVSKQFNKSDERDRFVMSDDMGIGFKLRDLPSVVSSESHTSMVSYDTPFRSAVRAREGQALLEEQKRVLYVAMTRAKDKLCIMLKKPDDTKLARYYRASLKTPTGVHDNAFGFYDWIFETISGYKCAGALFDDFSFERSRTLEDLSNSFSVKVQQLSSEYSAKDSMMPEKLSDDEIHSLTEQIRKRISFEYSSARLTKIPSKISVSDINKNLLNEQDPIFDKSKAEIRTPAFLFPERCTPAEKGTAMHMFMQYADYSRAEIDPLSEAKQLLSSGYINEKQFSVLDYDKISSFFESNVYTEIKKSKKVYRESPFTLSVPVSELYGDDLSFQNKTLLLQGIIDCFFEDENGNYTVVDFKTDIVKDLNILKERYTVQMNCYKRAVKEMTGTEKVRVLLYSFHRGNSIEI